MSTTPNEKTIEHIKKLLAERKAVLIAHFYTPGEIQKIAEETGGKVGDSLEMARFGQKHPAKTLVVAGVRFMGETAKILNPEKKVLIPNLKAECSLDLSCPPDEFAAFCKKHPDKTVVVYVNSSAKVKAMADWTVTSSSAVKIVQHLTDLGEKIIWAPDRYLGDYVQKQTGANMLLWHGSCVVHEQFKAASIIKLKNEYSKAAILVHPESPAEVIALADTVGSTSQILKAARELPNQIFIIVTDSGLLYKLKQENPNKTFIPAPTGGISGPCQSCAHCEWMGLNTLEALEKVLETEKNEIIIPPEIIKQAVIPLQRMLDFTKK